LDALLCIGLVHFQGLGKGLPLAQKSLDAAPHGGCVVGLSAMDPIWGSPSRIVGGSLYGPFDGAGFERPVDGAFWVTAHSPNFAYFVGKLGLGIGFGLVDQAILLAFQAAVMTALLSRLADYGQFLKLRLSLLVIFSAVLGYLIAAGDQIEWGTMGWLALGGFLVTGASNGLNQIIERDTDALMRRTEGRPVPSGRMGLREAWALATAMGISGLAILYHGTTQLSVQMGAVALLSYVFAYTPLKKVTPIAVLVGAFPGAMPVLIGYSAFAGHLNLEAGLLFLVQFFWQFPHFWSIAWVLHEDYKRAGFHLLPTREEPQMSTARIILWYTVALLPFAMAPWWYGFQGMVGAIVCLIMTLWFVYAAWRLFKGADKPLARKLMFASFVYLPIVQLAYWLDAIR